MAWIELTEDDLTSTLAGPEIEKIKAAALKLGQADPIQASLDESVNKARGYIAACPRNRLNEGVTIPERVKGEVLDIAAHRVLTRVLQVPNKARQDRYDDAIELLKDVARCKFRLEDAEIPADQQEQGPSFPPPSVRGPRRQFTRDRFDGM